jgi:hypothetical protein
MQAPFIPHKDTAMNHPHPHPHAHTHTHSRLGIALATATLFGLSACGGGGGDSPAAPVTTTFSGVAATGAAMANAAIDIRCASGSGTTTALANGSYSKDIASVTLPCALQATGSDGTVLYSVTSATATSSNTQVAHITPLTQLLVASLTGANPATFFSTVSTTPASITSVVNDSAIATAQTAVLAILADTGISTASLPNLINGSLVAGSTSSVYDVALETLKNTLTTNTTGTTLATLATAAAAANPTSTPTTGVASLPANLLLKPAASNCSALRSGEYIVVNPVRNSTLANQTGTVSLNASTLTWTDTSVADGGGTMVANGDCSYTIDASNHYVVSQAGVLMGTNTEAGVTGLSIIFPKQTIAVSELAGTWNMAGIEAGGTSPLNHGTVTLDSTGLATTLTDCDGAAPGGACETVTSTATNGIRVSSNSAGGFDLVSTLVGEAWTDRVFAYRSGSGHLMMVSISDNGSLTVLTKQRTLGLPTVGEPFAGGWDLTINNQLSAGILNSYASGSGRVISVDTATSSSTRMQKNTAGVDDYTDTVVQNSPRAGFNYRAAGTTTSILDGRTVTIRARANLTLRGMGVSFALVPHINSLRMSVDMAN